MVLGTLLTAPAAPKRGAAEVNWWRAARGSAPLLAAVGIPLGAGRRDASAACWPRSGGVLVVVGAALAFP